MGCIPQYKPCLTTFHIIYCMSVSPRHLSLFSTPSLHTYNTSSLELDCTVPLSFPLSSQLHLILPLVCLSHFPVLHWQTVGELLSAGEKFGQLSSRVPRGKIDWQSNLLHSVCSALLVLCLFPCASPDLSIFNKFIPAAWRQRSLREWQWVRLYISAYYKVCRWGREVRVFVTSTYEKASIVFGLIRWLARLLQ